MSAATRATNSSTANSKRARVVISSYNLRGIVAPETASGTVPPVTTAVTTSATASATTSTATVVPSEPSSANVNFFNIICNF